MRSIGIIPARYASTRLPAKMLIEVCGKSILQMTYEQALKSKKLSEIIIATDDKRIFDKAESFNAKVVMTDPACKSGTDRIVEAVKDIEADVVVNIQGDEPLISAEDVDRLVDCFSEGEGKPPLPPLSGGYEGNTLLGGYEEADISTLCHLISSEEAENPDIVKVVKDVNDFALFFSRAKIPFDRDNLGYNKYYKHIGIYAYKRDALLKFANLPESELEKTEKLEQMRALENGLKIKVVETENKTVSIDTEEDLERLKELLMSSSAQAGDPV